MLGTDIVAGGALFIVYVACHTPLIHLFIVRVGARAERLCPRPNIKDDLLGMSRRTPVAISQNHIDKGPVVPILLQNLRLVGRHRVFENLFLPSIVPRLVHHDR